MPSMCREPSGTLQSASARQTYCHVQLHVQSICHAAARLEPGARHRAVRAGHGVRPPCGAQRRRAAESRAVSPGQRGLRRECAGVAGTNAPTVLRREALEYRTERRRRRRADVRLARCALRPKRPCWHARRPCASGTPTARTSATTRPAARRPANSATTISIRWPWRPAQLAGFDGRQTLVAMATLDEIRGRLAEVFALKNHKIDHVVHGAIASAAVYGAVLGATVDQIESAIGLVVAHYVPFRAIRHGHQLSDSKGAVGGDQRRSGRHQHAAGDARIRRPGRHLPQSAGAVLPVRAAGRARHQSVRPDAGHGGRRLRRDGHALQAGAVRAPIGGRDSRHHQGNGRRAEVAR